MKKENKAGNELLGRRKSRIFALWVNVCLIFSLLLNSVTAMAQERGGTKVKVACVGASTTFTLVPIREGIPLLCRLCSAAVMMCRILEETAQRF